MADANSETRDQTHSGVWCHIMGEGVTKSTKKPTARQFGRFMACGLHNKGCRLVKVDPDHTL